MSTQLTARIAELTTARVPFVHATVVRAQEPTSAHAGDQAIVLADGSMEGFVGGQCAAGSVRTVALGALQQGTSVLLRVLPEGETSFPDSPGASIVVNPCLSGGALEIYLEPLLPSPLLHLVGGSPTAEAVAALAPTLGFVVQREAENPSPEGATAVVVSSHGGDEARAVRAALDAGVGFVGLVCGRRRGKVLLDELGLGESERARVHPHVGLDIGARTAAEVALSIMAELVRAVRVEGLTPPPAGAGAAGAAASARGTAVEPPRTVTDPVCGMTVTVMPETPHLVVDGTDYWFCNPGCRDEFLRTRRS